MSPKNEPARKHDPVPPHTPLTHWYASDAERSRYVEDLFNRSARYYNTVEGIFLNVGLLYRRISLRLAGVKPGMRVLDVAVGTGAVSRGAVRLVGPEGRVVGVDPNAHMLAEARKILPIPLVRGVAQELPIASRQFDFVTMGIALRHVPDLVGAFREYLRVLKPGGRVWILEAHVARSKLGHWLTKLLWKHVVPGLTWLFTRSADAKELMDYYWDTIDQCVPPEQIVAAMREAGFADVRYRLVVPGSFCEYTARRPEAA
jgi:demethylmenaquinone methyltransferase/2-methoxy-6-polyprenyl-1,4-benzoquinol methylase